MCAELGRTETATLLLFFEYKSTVCTRNLTISCSLTPQDRCVTYQGQDGITSLSWSPTSNHLASGNWDGKVSVWRVEHHGDGTTVRFTEVLQYQHRDDDGRGQPQPALDVCWSADGSEIYSGGGDRKVRVAKVVVACTAASGQALGAVIGTHTQPGASVFMRMMELLLFLMQCSLTHFCGRYLLFLRFRLKSQSRALLPEAQLHRLGFVGRHNQILADRQPQSPPVDAATSRSNLQFGRARRGHGRGLGRPYDRRVRPVRFLRPRSFPRGVAPSLPDARHFDLQRRGGLRGRRRMRTRRCSVFRHEQKDGKQRLFVA